MDHIWGVKPKCTSFGIDVIWIKTNELGIVRDGPLFFIGGGGVPFS